MRRVGPLVKEHLFNMQQPYTIPAQMAPVTPKAADVPIRAAERWQFIDKRALKKRFPFDDLALRNQFVNALLGYETEIGHCATITVAQDAVHIEVGTLDVGTVTELDREYSKYCDVLYRDIVYVV